MMLRKATRAVHVGDITHCTDFQIDEIKILDNYMCEHGHGHTCVVKLRLAASVINATTDKVDFVWSVSDGHIVLPTTNMAEIWVTSDADKVIAVTCTATEAATAKTFTKVISVTTIHAEV